MKVMTIANMNTIESREVAPMIGKDHAHLCRDIKGYIDAISENPKLDSQNYFIPDTYKVEGNNKTYPCYRLTKMGCEMVANKLTGKKGILFTAEYVKRFNEMEAEQAGSYMIADPVARALKWAEEQKAHRQQVALLEANNARQEQIIGELKPKADYTDMILQNKGLVPITAIAKDYGMSGVAMNEKLHEMKIIYKMGRQWLLYSKYQAKGYTHSETVNFKHKDGRDDVAMNTKWTQKGRLFLYEKLKEQGILPVIERTA